MVYQYFWEKRYKYGEDPVDYHNKSQVFHDLRCVDKGDRPKRYTEANNMNKDENYNHFLAVGNQSIKKKGRDKTKYDNSHSKKRQSSSPHIIYHESADERHNNLEQSQVIGVVECLLRCHDVLEYLLGVVEDSIDSAQLIGHWQNES